MSARKKRRGKKAISSSDTEESEEWTDSGASVLQLSDPEDEDDLVPLVKERAQQNGDLNNGDFVLVSFPGKKVKSEVSVYCTRHS